MSISRSELKKILLTTPDGLIAGGFGSGLSPKAPGTAGSAAALIPGVLLLHAGLPVLAAAIVVCTVVGIWACERTGKRLGVHDHGAIVIDEFAGLWIALVAATVSPWSIAAAFVLFRVFDILKPPPIGWLDRHIHGGAGVMVDDLVAGVFAAAALYGLRSLGAPV